MFQLKEDIFPILGSHDRAEKLVEWSNRNPVGTEMTKADVLWGLVLQLRANGDNPSFDILISNEPLREFIHLTGPGSQGIIASYGITLAWSQESIAIYMSQDEKNVVSMYSARLDTISEAPHTHLGRVYLLDNGPVFYSGEEMLEQEAREAAAAKQEKTAKASVAETDQVEEVDWEPLSEEYEDDQDVEENIEDLLSVEALEELLAAAEE